MTGRHIYGKLGDPDRYLIDGQEVTEAAYNAAFPSKPMGCFATESPRGWPIASDALACLPNQVQEMEAAAVKAGVPTEFLRDGRPLMRSGKHFREYCKKHGYVHRGY